MSFAADLESIRAARDRLAGRVHKTPAMTCSALDELAGRPVFLKCENLQRTGSFKIRGALNAVLKLDEGVAAAGVVTHSSGNFAQALALAARLRGIPAHIVMPSNAPAVKQRAVAGYGARIILCPPTQADREAAAEATRQETGATLVHPYDHADVIAGQGTIGLELLDQVPDLQTVIAPVGGGGLASGIALALAGASPDVAMHGAEPLGADDATRSLALGRRLPQNDPRTIADGLRTGLGELTWPVVRDLLRSIETVEENAIITAMRLLWERAKIVVEPSGAVSLAVALSEARPAGEGPLAVVLSGGNVDLDALPWVVSPR